jgi:hypothetical protein
MNASTKNAKDQAHNAMEKAQETGEKAKDTLHEAGRAASSVADAVTEKARDAANWAGDKAKDATNWACDRADSAAERVGDGLRNVGGKVRDLGPSEGVFGSATDTLAKGIERTGDYLREEGVTGMGRDIMNLVKSYPVPALLIGVGLGYLLARATTSNRS